MLQDTCSHECKFWKKYGRHCPFFQETVWKGKKEGDAPYLLNDCAPKRSLLMQMDMHNMLLGSQEAAEEERNTMHKAFKAMLLLTGAVVNQVPQVTINVEDVVDLLELPASEEEVNADNNNKLQGDTTEDSPSLIGQGPSSDS